MPGRQLDALRRDQIGIGIVLRRDGPVDGLEHALVLLRPGDRQHVRMRGRDLFRLGAHAAGDDDFAVFGQRRADGGQRFRLRAVEKAAGIDDGEVGIGVVAGQLVAFRAQPRDDALGIDQRLRAAERDERDAGGPAHEKLEVLRFGGMLAARIGTASRKGQAPQSGFRKS